MKKNLLLCLFTLSATCAFAFGAIEKSGKVVTVYAYDSFTAEWGPGPQLERKFEAATGYDLQFVTFEDAPAVLAQAAIEGKNCKADVLVGIDNFLLGQAKKADVLKPYKAKNLSRISQKSLIFDETNLLTPYDYGYFAFMFDTASKLQAPKSLAELADSRYSKSIVIMDPRTSSVGLGLAMWTRAAYGEAYLDIWKKLKPSILSMTSGWSAGYGLFTKGEAALALSYTSSEAYHVRYDKTDRYKALIFDDGHIAQIEGLGLAKYAPNEAGAKAFIEFMLSEEAQAILPETQWMYPVALDAPMPESYAHIGSPLKVLQVPDNPQNLVNAVIEVLK